MGDRVSIAFRSRRDESVALFSHWGGMTMVAEANNYGITLCVEAKKQGGMMPLYRLEPSTVMVDFIRHLTGKHMRITNDLYLGKDEHDGDNSDNGHHVIDLDAMMQALADNQPGIEPATPGDPRMNLVVCSCGWAIVARDEDSEQAYLDHTPDEPQDDIGIFTHTTHEGTTFPLPKDKPQPKDFPHECQHPTRPDVCGATLCSGNCGCLCWHFTATDAERAIA